MAHCPDYEEFNELKQLVEEIKQENQFLKSLMLGHRWLNRTQAMKALGCKHQKLWQLTKDDTVKHRYEGKSPFYDAFSVRAYLMGQKFDTKEVEKRILEATYLG